MTSAVLMSVSLSLLIKFLVTQWRCLFSIQTISQNSSLKDYSSNNIASGDCKIGVRLHEGEISFSQTLRQYFKKYSCKVIADTLSKMCCELIIQLSNIQEISLNLIKSFSPSKHTRLRKIINKKKFNSHMFKLRKKWNLRKIYKISCNRTLAMVQKI